MDEARQVAEALSAKRMETLRNDAHNLNQAISRRTQQEVFAIARKALTDLARALNTASAPVLVRSAFELPTEQRAAIQQALNETFSAEIQVRFETAPDVISGIELTTNGQKVAWSITDYLASLEKSVGELLTDPSKAPDRPQTKSEANADHKSKSGTNAATPEEAK